MKTQSLIKLSLHVGSWGLLLLTPLLYPPELPSPTGDVLTVVARLPIILTFTFLIFFFYGNYLYLIPRIWQRFNHWYYLGTILVCLATFLAYQLQVRQWLAEDFAIPAVGMSLRFRVTGATIMFFCSWVTSTSLWLLAERRRAAKQLEGSERKRIQAELEQLKGQLNPHFLFNTLNGIYALTLSQDQRAPQAVLKLSKLLDYVLTDLNQDQVHLQRDLDHLLHFIELNRLRLSSQSPVSVTLRGDFTHAMIAPLLLLPFVENAFKHGISNTTTSPINVSLDFAEGKVTFKCTNRRFAKRYASRQHGIGIRNTQRRLQLRYPDQHCLRIKQTEEWYEVFLSISLHNNTGALETVRQGPTPDQTSPPQRLTSPTVTS